MAEVLYRNDKDVWVKLKIPLAVFESAVAAFGSQGRALRAFREDLPAQFGWLERRVLADPERDIERRAPGRSPRSMHVVKP